MTTRRIALATAVCLLAIASVAAAATSEVSQPVQVTDSAYYERGQSIVYDGTNYWLFYGRSASCTDPYSSGDPDVHDYQIYYKKASSVGGLAAATAVVVPGASDCYLGETGATVVDGNVWTFGTVPSLNYPGEKSLYGWYTSDGGSTWTQVADLWDDMPDGAAHHDEIGFDGKLFVMANYPESYAGWYSKWTDDPTAGTITWSTPIPLNSTSNLINGTGHFYAEGTDLYIGILRTSPTKDNKVLQYDDSPEAWSELCTASSTGWDGTLFKVGGDYVYAQAPWVSPRQYVIAWTGSTPGTVLGGSSHMVSEGKYGSNGWVDMWPIGFTDAGGTSYLFYTSERDEPSAEGTGNIWYLEFDWDPAHDHYTYVQEAIDAASGGDVIDVAAGTYAERLSIGSGIDLRGAQYGVDPTVGGARTDPSAESIVDITGLGVTNPNVAVEVGSGATGASVAGFTLIGSPTSHYADECVVRAWTDDLSLEDNIIDGYFALVHKGADGIAVNRNKMTVNKNGVTIQPNAASNVTISGNAIAQGGAPAADGSGIYVTGCTTITVSGNTATGFTGNNGIGGSNITDADISGNDFSGCRKGVNFWGSTTFVDVTDNDLSGCSVAGVNIKGQDITITGNDCSGGDVGVSIARHVIDTERVTVSGNDLSGNTTFGLEVDTGAVTETVDGSANYWGSTDPTVVRAAANAGDGVDYTPWLAGGATGSPGFTGDYSILYVDDDSEQVGSAGKIDEAIGLVSGSTVNVAAGTYNESVTIDKSVDLLAADGAIIDGTGISYEGVFIDAGDVTLDNFEIRNFASGAGVLLWVDDDYFDGWTDVVITNNEIHDVGDDAWGFGIYVGTESERLNPASELYDPAMTGLLDFTGLVVSGNEIYNTSGAALTLQSLESTGDMLDISDNHIHDSVMSGIWIDTCWDLAIEGNEIDDNVTGIFISAYADGAYEGTPNGTYDPQNIHATYNMFDGNDSDIKVYDLTCDALSFNYNMFENTSSYGIYNFITSCMFDGEYNWWGDASGPSGVGPGTGAQVTDGVDYDPWLSGNVYCDPDPLDITESVTYGDIDVDYLGGGGGLLYSYSVTVTWDAAVVSLVSITEGDLLQSHGSTQMFVYGTGNSRTIDCALLSGIPGVTGPGTMFTLRFSPVGYGESDVDLGLVAFRNNINEPLSGFYEDDGLIRVDTAAPAITRVEILNDDLTHTDDYAKNGDDLTLEVDVTDDYPLTVDDIEADFSDLISGGGTAVNPTGYTGGTATWTFVDPTLATVPDDEEAKTVSVVVTDGLGNSSSGDDSVIADNTPPAKVTGFDAAPAHEEVSLVWDPASGNDTYYYGVLVRYDVWGDYPLYDGPDPAPYPTDETDGAGEAFSGDDTGATHSIVPRDIHYYSAFVYDWALNYSPVDGEGQDRATNYWLGDVARGDNTWNPDGYVHDPDIAKLSGTYGGAPSGEFLKCDVGPTDDYSRLGIPVPDDFVGFEDLMIFAMNYDVVMPRVVPFLDEAPEGELMLALHEVSSEGGLVDVALRLAGNTNEVKGISTRFSFDPSELELVSARETEEMHSPLAPVFFWHGASGSEVQVDLAVLGTGVTIGGSGDVAVLTFRMLGDGYELAFEEAVLRGAENEDLTAELEGLEAKPQIPTVFRLVQNSPNPFNPVTTVGYHVPHECEVGIRVYDVAGRMVRTLVDGVEQAGVHEVVWDGRSERGEAVGSGVYFCVMEAEGFRDSRKMTLLK